MIKNLSQVQSLEYDFIIVGTGPAGITTALELEKNKKTVLLLEGGGMEHSEESQSIYNGSVVGNMNFDIKRSRVRYFGGSSNHWGGMSRPFSESELSAFPINKKDLDLYLSNACAVLEISDQFIKDKEINADFERIEFKYSPPVRFNSKYKKSIIDSNFIDLVLNANLVEISGDNGKVSHINVSDQNLNFSRLKVNKLVLACGGLENSRLLLWSQYLNKELFANLPIGKKWMEHPHFSTGEIVLHESDLQAIFGESNLEGKSEKFFLQPTKSLMVAKKINHAGIRFAIDYSDSKLKKVIKDILCINPEYGEKLVKSLLKKNLMCTTQVNIAWEQSPRESNKVSLNFNKKDIFGIPQILLEWKIDKQDKKTALVCMQRLSKLFLDVDIGRVGIFEYLYHHYSAIDEKYGGGCCTMGRHHMGGTPIGVSTLDGVVDSNLKVFNIDNLWVSGSSTFASGGHVNPTLTIVQFAMRLGQHLSSTLV
jgi:hypothetical protein